jgi:hypothetical protein
MNGPTTDRFQRFPIADIESYWTVNLHELELNWHRSDGVDYALVRIRLFANLGAPTYLVVAGSRL